MGLEKKGEDGHCGQLYRNLTALVDNLDPYFEFVTCARENVIPSRMESADGSGLSIRLLAKGKAWVVDGVFDPSNRSEFGPVFHHGVKIHRNPTLIEPEKVKKYELNLGSAESESYGAEKACDPIQTSTQCATEATYFQSLLSPNACARKMTHHAECSDLFMFSTSYPEWGCRCCSLNGSQNLTDNDSNWALYSAANCMKSSAQVLCGGHAAPNCEKCPQNSDTGEWVGESWCNGDCRWEKGICVSKHDAA